MRLHFSSFTGVSLHGGCHLKPRSMLSILEAHRGLIPTSHWFCFQLQNNKKKSFRGLGIHDESLPWIEAKQKKLMTNKQNSRSSWKEAADNYFANKHGVGTRFDNDLQTSYKSFGNDKTHGKKHNTHIERPNIVSNNNPIRAVGRSNVVDSEEEEGSQLVNDERWENIKTNYRKMVETDDKRKLQRNNILWDHKEEWGKKTWKEVTGSNPPKMVGEAVYGVGPVLAALTVARREFYVLYVQEGLDLSSRNKKRKDKGTIAQILQMAENLGLTVKEASKHDLNMLVECRPHQGLVLDASSLEMVNITELESVNHYERNDSASLWVALDEVTDPQNFGAVVRSAYFFGANGVIVCAKNSAPLSGVVSKASAGSLELTELRSCRNMMNFLELSAANGWRVLGASMSQQAVPLNQVSPGVPTILVLGSEGRGLRSLVSRSCSQLIGIPGTLPRIPTKPFDISSNGDQSDIEEFNSFMAVESLNVSVAAGILIYHLIGSSGHSLDSKGSVPLE